MIRPRDLTRPPAEHATLRNAVIDAVDVQAARVDVAMDGGTVTGVPYLDSYTPHGGDAVVVIAHRRSMLVLGTIAQPTHAPHGGPPA